MARPRSPLVMATRLRGHTLGNGNGNLAGAARVVPIATPTTAPPFLAHHYRVQPYDYLKNHMPTQIESRAASSSTSAPAVSRIGQYAGNWLPRLDKSQKLTVERAYFVEDPFRGRPYPVRLA